jgi:hypothetical protein
MALRRLTCPQIPSSSSSSPHRLTWLLSATLSGRATTPVSGQLSARRAGGGRRVACPRVPVAFRPPAFASGSSCARWGISPSSRLGYRPRLHAAGPQRGCHVPHERDATGVGAPSTPRTTVLPDRVRRLRSASATSQRPVPEPHFCIPSAGVLLTRHHQGFTCVHPSGLPLRL